MQRDLLSRDVARSFGSLRNWRVALRRAGYPLILLSRLSRRRLTRTIHRRVLPLRTSLNWTAPSLGGLASDFGREGWVHVESFLPADLHHMLLEQWPARSQLDPFSFKGHLKAYDRGLRWPAKDHLDYPSGLRAAYEFLSSDAICAELTRMAADGVLRGLRGAMCSYATAGSQLIPHRDGLSPQLRPSTWINIILFVAASGEGWDSGGTSMLRTSDFSKPVFTPTSLHNSALIYSIHTNGLYHGFPPLRRGHWRKAITAKYCAREFTRSGIASAAGVSPASMPS